ncbi:MAG: hypothetical protein KGL31_08355 [candidate division NC10 bacterium]|nr:hypothetical protein [candidate division NC10 bacterium]MDE2321910.1 hypothetical protein [candidate division NC10 bacterium]MDE2484552.1 hypothetical protein [candidate division NC10 bacterium]
MKERPRQDEHVRVDHLVGVIFCSVTGFNAVLLYNHAIQGNWGWFTLILLVCVLFPGLVPYFNLVQALREGRLKRRWQEPLGVVIGAIDSIAILSHWPGALVDVSWVSTFIIGTAAAFFLVVQSR